MGTVSVMLNPNSVTVLRDLPAGELMAPKALTVNGAKYQANTVTKIPAGDLEIDNGNAETVAAEIRSLPEVLANEPADESNQEL